MFHQGILADILQIFGGILKILLFRFQGRFKEIPK